MEEALVAWLLAALPAVAPRITWLTRPSAIFPAITLQVADQATEYTHSGRADLLYPRIQFDVWSATYSEGKRLARQLVAVLEAGADRSTAVFFEGIEVNNTDMDPETLAGGTKVFRIMIEYMVPYRMKEA